jgi:hypothetical protein
MRGFKNILTAYPHLLLCAWVHIANANSSKESSWNYFIAEVVLGFAESRTVDYLFRRHPLKRFFKAIPFTGNDLSNALFFIPDISRSEA